MIDHKRQSISSVLQYIDHKIEMANTSQKWINDSPIIIEYQPNG